MYFSALIHTHQSSGAEEACGTTLGMLVSAGPPVYLMKLAWHRSRGPRNNGEKSSGRGEDVTTCAVDASCEHGD